jgi:hypothetical protein
VVPHREPRLSSLTVAVGSPEVRSTGERAIESGLVVVEHPDHDVVLPPEGVEGALGWRVGIRITAANVEIASS